MSLRKVLATGVEARLHPATTQKVDGEDVIIPEHWTVFSVFSGVDASGRLSMCAALAGAVTRGRDTRELRDAVHHALRQFPVDGRDIRVLDGHAVSRVRSRDTSRLKPCRLWVPPQGAVTEDLVEGVVVGAGVAVEVHGDAGYLVPYYGVLVDEQRADGSVAPRVVPARILAPRDPLGLLEPGQRLADVVPASFTDLCSHVNIGGKAHVWIRAGEDPHYFLDEVYPDTVVGAAFAEAGVHRDQFAGEAS